ncbi:Aste57867_18307 [Aphanomyces stellatus]|uniref:Aste57867_18307 protein n=1 Tax=Aphanomyces stellatus TaxID=120398 RepID=A0A485LAL9_9STRA|nr:hypothetical protein As57867_018245 [Aphanomyces stellatus]VFT95043.1 Aste57867_18307 [Aphanomyces stellatus]
MLQRTWADERSSETLELVQFRFRRRHLSNMQALFTLMGLVKLVLGERERKKYSFVVYLVHCLHYHWAARKPTLTHQDSDTARHVLDTCHRLLQKYHPTWYLFNGHLQTMMVALSNKAPQIAYKRQLLTLPDGGTVSLDWALPTSMVVESINDKTNQPTILMLHGLTGSSEEPYIRKTVEKLLTDGWRVVVLNARGCGRNPVTSSKLFCPAYTDDVREAVNHVIHQHLTPGAPLLAIGFSLGANILLKYIGEEGPRCPLKAAVSVANPYDFVVTNLHMTHSWFNRIVYNAGMTQNLLKMVFHETNAHEHLVDHPHIDMARLREAKTLTEYDDHFSRHTFGYLTPMDLYRDASSAAYLKHIAIPTLCLSAADDPICPHTVIPYAECRANPNIVLAVTHSGGHIGYFTSQHLFDDSPSMWCADVVAQYVGSMLDMKAKKASGDETPTDDDDDGGVMRMPCPL